MTISAKGRRRISVDGAQFLWWVAEDVDRPLATMLTAVSVDRTLFVRYDLNQPAETRHIVVLGPRFRSVVGCGGPWRRFRCPAFGTATEMRPRDVAALLRWALEPGLDPVEVDYRGKPVAP